MDQEGLVDRTQAKNLFRRIGEILLLTSFLLLLVAFLFIPGSAGLLAVICAHIALYSGFLLATIGDSMAKRPFDRAVLCYTVIWGFILLIAGPVIRAAGY